ncbi:bacteriophage-related DNA polymerase [Bordetella ansorpii]|uniref:Type-4 uracil-DNA glycosylase n=1 Tax=Bordetella ansorpii TaxID=288768 RepID=A0A157PPW1_9BORD|nr:uracil-DNA glycosylase [Bordetella ansorpii]SAI35384.1 bacteriophage-related DNA polymerase [Bordetella ansorpii]
MTGAHVQGAAPSAPRVNPLQRLWLRELGIEKTWLREVAPVASDAALAKAPQAGQGATPAGRADAAPAPVRASAAAAAGADTPAHGVPPTEPPAGDRAARGPGAQAETVPAKPVGAAPSTASEHIKAALAATGRNAAPPPAAAAAPRGPAPYVAETPEAKEARLRQVQTADVETLRGMVTGCEACGLCRGRRNAVFGMGATAPRWMVVGEAPGEQEDRQGLPFVGRSGQLLDAMLASVGMSREQDVFIANVIKCRPPGNRNPTPDEIAACSPYLMRQIALLKPERILVVGRFAAQTLLGTDATIGSLRGRVHHLESDGRQIPVIVSYHPAYLLRSPAEKARSWQDLRLAATLS